VCAAGASALTSARPARVDLGFPSGGRQQRAREWYDQTSAVLEFEAEIEGRYVQGVDLLRWNDDGRLVSFTVMVRPLRALEKLVELMARELAPGQS